MSGWNTLLYVEEESAGNPLAGQSSGEWTRQQNPRWFKFRTLAGVEYQQAMQTQATTSHQLECHYFAGAHSRMRLTAGDDPNTPTRIFNVESVVDRDDQHRFLDWMVREVSASG